MKSNGQAKTISTFDKKCISNKGNQKTKGCLDFLHKLGSEAQLIMTSRLGVQTLFCGTAIVDDLQYKNNSRLGCSALLDRQCSEVFMYRP